MRFRKDLRVDLVALRVRVDVAFPKAARQANVSVTQQLVDDVVAAGGSLRVPRKRWYDRESVDCENRARLAERYRKVPAGKRLVVSTIDDKLEIRLVDAPDRGAPAELVPVVVPANVSRYHAAGATKSHFDRYMRLKCELVIRPRDRPQHAG